MRVYQFRHIRAKGEDSARATPHGDLHHRQPPGCDRHSVAPPQRSTLLASGRPLRAAIVQGTRTPPSHGGNPGSNPGSGIARCPRAGTAPRGGSPSRYQTADVALPRPRYPRVTSATTPRASCLWGGGLRGNPRGTTPLVPSEAIRRRHGGLRPLSRAARTRFAGAPPRRASQAAPVEVRATFVTNRRRLILDDRPRRQLTRPSRLSIAPGAVPLGPAQNLNLKAQEISCRT